MNRKQRRASKKNGSGNGSGDSRLDQAIAYHQTGRLIEADGLYRQVLEDNPKDTDALRLRGALAYQMDNPGAAVEILSEAQRLDPKNPEVLNLLGLAFDAGGNSQAAERVYRKALSLSPKSPELWNNLGASLRDGGKMEPAAEAFGRAVVLKPDYVEACQNLGVTLYHLGKLDAAKAAFETALNASPGNPDVLMNFGIVLSAMGDLVSARACFQDVLSAAPDDPDVLTNLAATQMRMEDLVGAEETARHALTLAPDSAGALSNLAMILTAGRHFEEAEGLYHDALRALPEHADIWGNYGNMLMAADRLEDAATAYKHARKSAPADARHAFQMGLCCLAQGDLQRGWQFYDGGLDCGERVPAFTPKLPRWKGEALEGSPLFIIAEQGLGDEIRSLSCLGDIMDKTEGSEVTLYCDSRLHQLVERSFPDVTLKPRNDASELGDKIDGFWLPMASITSLCRNSIGDFPDHSGYLYADPDLVGQMQETLSNLGDGLKVGIAWRSGLQRIRSQQALSSIDDWGQVLNLPNVQFINLQYGDVIEELAEKPVHIVDGVDLKDDLDAAAALTQACDLVINMGTSVGDMAGALGVPCWSLLLKPDWVTLGSQGHPFYPATEVFWRGPDEDWSAVIDRVRSRLSTT